MITPVPDELTTQRQVVVIHSDVTSSAFNASYTAIVILINLLHARVFKRLHTSIPLLSAP